MPARSWRCAQCGVVRETTDELALTTPVYDLPLPPGWVWHKYRSMRFPDRDTRMLGCSEEHARTAALQYASPFEED